MPDNLEVILQHVNTLKAKLDTLKQNNQRNTETLERWYDSELTYTSNALEGNTITRSETAIILEKGITVQGKPLKDHNEILDHYEAIKFCRKLAVEKTALTEAVIQRIHQHITAKTLGAEAGLYSQFQRRILGSNTIFPSPAKIPIKMAVFAEWLQQSAESPILQAIEAHYKLVAIHPFSDGNGRTARLVMNTLLWQNNYPAINIKPEHRLEYINTLETYGNTNDAEPYRIFMVSALEKTMLDHISFLED